MDGTIKRIKGDKGFGFIQDDAGVERFFHISEVQNLNGQAFTTALENRAVTFDPDRGPKGERAVNVNLR